MKKHQQDCMINILINTFKFICRYEYNLTFEQIEQELAGIENMTFEQKIKFLNTYKFMKAPIKTQFAKYGIKGVSEK